MGITQHITGTDNVLSVANLAMLTGQLGTGSGVNPLRGQNNVQGACDMGALPNVSRGYQRVDERRLGRSSCTDLGRHGCPRIGLTVVEMHERRGEGKIKALYIMGENPMVTDPNLNHVEQGLRKLEFLVVQDIFLTETAQPAHVVLPGVVVRGEGRHVHQHRAARPALSPRCARTGVARLADHRPHRPEDARHPIPLQIVGRPLRRGPKDHPAVRRHDLCQAGKARGLHWPCPAGDHPGTPILHMAKFSHPDGLGIFFGVSFKPPEKYPTQSTRTSLRPAVSSSTTTRAA